MVQANQFGGQRARPQGGARPQHQFPGGGQRGPQTRGAPQGAMQGAGQQPMRGAPQGKPNVPGAQVNPYYAQMGVGPQQQQQRVMGQHIMQGAPIEQEPLSSKLAAAPPQVGVFCFYARVRI